MAASLGVDVGGTFTDLALWDEARGRLAVFKLPSVPSDPAEGILAGIRTIVAREQLRPADLTFVAHGTTVATNALLERKGARTALITTRGFRDLLEIARQKRPDLYDLQADKPVPLVSRDLRVEVRERLLPDGTVLDKLALDDVRAALDAVAAAGGVESIAVCFLYSFVDGTHEHLVADEIRERHPRLYVSLSSAVSPEFREYERLSTTVLNAYLGPTISRYVRRFDEEVRRLGVPSAPFINQSNGGIISIAAAAAQPVRTLLSGPSAGVMGAAWAARDAGVASLITFDMGGTSTDVARVEGGEPVVAAERTIAGYPVRIPTLEIESVGAGGGSLAWVDSGGALKVGPESAGAMPGPACYGRGGTRPTVTDANIVLGRLSGEHLLDGQMTLHPELAARAIDDLAAALGVGRVEAARGILSVVQTNMLGAIRIVSVRKGYDPRHYTMVAFGGAGPLHAASLARDLGIRQVLVPPAPGILCALGLLVEPLRLDLVRTVMMMMGGPDMAPHIPQRSGRPGEAGPPLDFSGVFDDLEKEARAWLDREGVPAARRRIVRAFDMRYLGQNFELRVMEPAARGDVAALRRAFFAEHERVYGYFTEDEPVQIVNVRLTALGEPEPLALPPLPAASRPEPDDARIGERSVWFDETGGFAPTPIYRRERLLAGHGIVGPAIVEQMDSTTVVLPAQTAIVDALGNLMIRIDA
ncbi:MAG: hydantoinase/oxoprolinase family protein [Candidatus Rokubacteria bacterium]|nr:hydantoinase/oxoprolinase family protein [Candidatus Rokubacteria bacterium]